MMPLSRPAGEIVRDLQIVAFDLNCSVKERSGAGMVRNCKFDFGLHARFPAPSHTPNQSTNLPLADSCRHQLLVMILKLLRLFQPLLL
jgi:hypothetical protein